MSDTPYCVTHGAHEWEALLTAAVPERPDLRGGPRSETVYWCGNCGAHRRDVTDHVGRIAEGDTQLPRCVDPALNSTE